MLAGVGGFETTLEVEDSEVSEDARKLVALSRNLDLRIDFQLIFEAVEIFWG